MENGSTSAAQLRSHAEAISQTFAQCERACLDVGMGLGDAIPGLNELAGFFTTLAQSLESEEFRRAGTDLQAVAGDIEAIGRDLALESKALGELLDLNRNIARLIDDLAGNLRVIAALVFNVKIEAALLNDHETNMIDFAHDLKHLSSNAVRALEDYQATHSKLFELLKRSCEAQVKFEEEYRSKLLDISTDIAASLETVDIRRRDIAKSLAEVGRQSQSIGMQIGQAVMALQVGDSTRQRIEHAQQALRLAAQVEAGDVEPIFEDRLASADPQMRSSLAAAICRLQSRQIEAALDQFSSEMDAVERLLDNLKSDADGLASRGRTLFGSTKAKGDSFIEDLKKKLELAHVMIDECRHARANVDAATSAVDVTTTDLRERTAGLSNIVTDITMIGLNTILKSSHLGQRGKCLTVIAQELQSYATEVVQGIKDLPPALQNVTKIVAHFSDVGKAHDADQMLTLSARMATAIASFDASGTQMSEALTRLKGETRQISSTLNDVMSRLRASDEIQKTLKSAVEAIDETAASFAVSAIEGEFADKIFAHIRASYTMAGERQIHDSFVGAPPDLEPQDVASNSDEDALMEACLF